MVVMMAVNWAAQMVALMAMLRRDEKKEKQQMRFKLYSSQEQTRNIGDLPEYLAEQKVVEQVDKKAALLAVEKAVYWGFGTVAQWGSSPLDWR